MRAKQPAVERDALPLQTSDANWLVAVRAAESKKASDIKVLDLREVTSFADYFVICTGANPRQIQAISDEVVLQLKQRNERVNSAEGYEGADWILLDYGDLIVHVFSEKAREYYDLDRLWRHARTVDLSWSGSSA
ncbi:MAG: ribosome silencing factor [Bryobacteraceae bacterium]|nr:ribosome silencing factor [Bryobacteraceae bacterium]